MAWNEGINDKYSNTTLIIAIFIRYISQYIDLYILNTIYYVHTYYVCTKFFLSHDSSLILSSLCASD